MPKEQAGRFRLMLNLKKLYEFVDYRHFKIENIHTVTDMMTCGGYVATIDLKEAYHSVSILKIM